MTSKIAVVGSNDSILIFKSIGVETFVTGADNNINLKELSENYSLILLTEDVAIRNREIIKEFTSPYPIFLTIPNNNGSTGYAMEQLKEQMEKSLGINILF